MIKEELGKVIKLKEAHIGSHRLEWEYDPNFIKKPEIIEPWERINGIGTEQPKRFVNSIYKPWLKEFAHVNDVDAESIVHAELSSLVDNFIHPYTLEWRKIDVGQALKDSYDELAEKLHDSYGVEGY